MADITPFKASAITLPQVEEIKIKLKYARLDDGMADVESNDLEIGHSSFKELVEYWRDEYDWRKYEAFLNTLNHFKTPIQVDGFEPLNIHYIHQKSSREDAIPLLFLHGWPGSFLEVTKILPLLTESAEDKQAFHVVAPSLPGYGFSQYSKKSVLD
ncbi:uncharacterized protein FIESC28_01859 [Fusarium coffeatum]|uniref:Epoxide hydrolase N-terminal domain-containing protein n=1 Tax=Fusarium coffeatum TaxID=231269 RepID=A0A366S8V1_9HYPO|nr:uncharacterized protein FIESC28_01859 [Fusarium coffeatum]RBR25422.1 hypothetical protein FIESC28_01859 [Fusarium coffeatum]